MAKKAEAKRRKPPADRKQAVIGVRCTDDQKDALEKKAKRRGLGVSTWLLQLGLSQPDDPVQR
ncbi:MAG: plasmid mobilization protein [Candidatus Binatia bacterium]